MRSNNLIQNNHRNSNSHDTTKIVVLLFLLLFVTQCFAFVGWIPMTEGMGLNQIIPIILMFAFINKKPVGTENFKPLVLMLTTWPFLSAIMSLAMYGQPLFDSFKGLLPNLFWLFYFILNRYHFKEKTVIRALLIYSLVMLSIMVVQQFTYPNAVFGVWSDELIQERGYSESVGQRNGIYRFLMHQNGYTAVPVLLFYLTLIRKHFTINRIGVVLLMLLAVYMSLTRQVIASTAFVVLLSVRINNKGSLNIKYLVIISLLAFAVYSYSDFLFGEMAMATKDDMNKDYIRILAYSFYWDRICDNSETLIVGHGIAKVGLFLHQFNYWQEVLKLYTSDIGIVGIWFHYGLIYVLLYFYSLYLIFKHRKQLPIYIILFTIFAGLMAVMIFPFWTNPKYYLIWAMMFYICDLHINKSSLRTKVENN